MRKLWLQVPQLVRRVQKLQWLKALTFFSTTSDGAAETLSTLLIASSKQACPQSVLSKVSFLSED